MEERRLRHLPVLGHSGSLVGIISDRDILRAMDPHSSTLPPGAEVKDFMNWPVLAAERTTPLVKVIDRLINERISALVITQGQSVVGIITTEDLLRVLRDTLLRETNPAPIELGSIAYSPVFQETLRELGALGV
jgi:CBS domain-containing protein